MAGQERPRRSVTCIITHASSLPGICIYAHIFAQLLTHVGWVPMMLLKARPQAHMGADMVGIMYEDRLDTTADGLEIGVTPGLQPGTVHVCVSGEIDFDSAAVLRRTLLAARVLRARSPCRHRAERGHKKCLQHVALLP
ncbi:hypothetical protein ACFYM0_02485 [Streptomyces sp. NPDC006487]|uniref:hypothetical protein n=1 Tax=Streptomyces sp. NPDC006487 TaxID=3364748 RepID=UPI00367FB392